MNTVIVMGAGAVGGYFGGKIARYTDCKVEMIARGVHLEALQRHGLCIVGNDYTLSIPVNARSEPDVNILPDLILFTVKSHDTSAAIQQINPVVGDHTQILTIQNGIENYPKLADAFGSDRIIQGFCKIGASVPKPGVIRHEAFGTITVGEYDGWHSERIQAMKKLCREAQIPLNIVDDINRKVWLKFAWNGIFNMLTATANVTVEKLFQNRETETLCYSIFDEVKAVAKSEGIVLTDDDARAIIEPARELKGFKTSTYQDRQKGKPMEYEAFTGAIIRLANKKGIAVPYNETIYALLKAVEE